ncbi:MAG TPA: hypothetical protein VN783_11970 [Thermoanaerobaculia bacterium]|nr:hypothetical protein [Thermoanaerobaculia bacterium]
MPLTLDPPPPVRVYRDADGDLRAEAGAGEGLLAAFLESDVQGSLAVGRELLEAIARVVAGDLPRFEWTGNAHTLTLTRKTARIRREVDPEAPALRRPLALFHAALEAWLQALSEG